MAAVPVTIIGSLTGKDGSQNVTLQGLASITGLEVGGGPIEPPGKPPSIWPSPGHPEHPIHIPPGIWPQPPDPDRPHPEHPIVIPKPPGIQGPDLQAKVIWIPPHEGSDGSWALILVPQGPVPTPSGGGRRG